MTSGKGIEIDDDYLPGIHGAELAARLYKYFDKPDEKEIVESETDPLARAESRSPTPSNGVAACCFA